jgi:hypothetical protein
LCWDSTRAVLQLLPQAGWPGHRVFAQWQLIERCGEATENEGAALRCE